MMLQMESAWINWATPRITEDHPHPSPYLGSDDPVERGLAKWCRQIKSKMKRHTLSDQEINQYSLLPGWSWGRNADEEFNKRSQRWSLMCHMKGRAPRQHKDATPEEKALHRWELRIQQYHRDGKLPPHHYAVLNQIPGWRWREAPRSVPFVNRLQQWTEFVNTNRRQPSVLNAQEAELAKWHQRMVSLYLQSKLPERKYQQLSALPGWSWSDVIDEAKRWSRWVQMNGGIFPSPSTVTNPMEARLGLWAENFRQDAIQGRFDQETTVRLAKVPHLQTFLHNRL